MKGCSSNNIKLEKGDSITKKKTLIHVDSFRVSLCNSAFISNEEMHAKNRENNIFGWSMVHTSSFAVIYNIYPYKYHL